MMSQLSDRKKLRHTYIVMMNPLSTKKRIKDPVCCYLRKLISPYGYGWKGDDGVGRHSNETLIQFYKGLFPNSGDTAMGLG
jgi:hypothetical protein